MRFASTESVVPGLTITSAAYTALPLVLLSLDVKLSSTESQKLKRKYRLNVYVEMMRHYDQRYDFAKVISDTVIKLLQSVDIKLLLNKLAAQESSSHTELQLSKGSRPRSWGDIITRNPQLYFKLSVSLDHSLSKGKYPCDNELPSWINGLSCNPKEKAIDSVAPGQVADFTSNSPDASLNDNMSFLQNHESLGLPQAYHLHESNPLSNNWISASFSDKPPFLGHSILEHLTPNEFVLDEHFEHNNHHHANVFSFDVFSDDPLEVTPGSFDGWCILGYCDQTKGPYSWK